MIQMGENMKKKEKKLIYVLCVVCIISFVILLISLLIYKEKTKEFTPPEFETNAISGVPKSPGESWIEIYQDGMSFSAHVCGELKINNSSADIYFTNDAENFVWMKLRIADEKGNILGETGLLKPNQYVKSVCLDVLPETGQKIKMKIMSYEPNTYYSAGSVTLNTVVG